MYSKHKRVILMKFRDDINLVGLKTIRNAFLLLTRIYYSNGPSGKHGLRLFE